MLSLWQKQMGCDLYCTDLNCRSYFLGTELHASRDQEKKSEDIVKQSTQVERGSTESARTGSPPRTARHVDVKRFKQAPIPSEHYMLYFFSSTLQTLQTPR